MILFDTETTGLIDKRYIAHEQQPHIIEFAGIKLDDETLEITDKLEFLCYPGFDIKPETTELTGITNEDLKGLNFFHGHIVDLENFFLGEEYLLAHNIWFDVAMISWELKRLGREFAFPYPPNQHCTVKLAQQIHPGKWLKLEELYEIATGEPLTDGHRAMRDVMALYECVKYLREKEVL